MKNGDENTTGVISINQVVLGQEFQLKNGADQSGPNNSGRCTGLTNTHKGPSYIDNIPLQFYYLSSTANSVHRLY